MNPRGEQRTSRSIRLTDEEYARCQEAADRDHRTFSDWARLRLLDIAEAELNEKPKIKKGK